jgi:hypothetical protein
VRKGEKIACGLCGLAVTVCDECSCETHELVCCGEPMKSAKAKPKKKIAKKASKK